MVKIFSILPRPFNLLPKLLVPPHNVSIFVNAITEASKGVLYTNDTKTKVTFFCWNSLNLYTFGEKLGYLVKKLFFFCFFAPKFELVSRV